MAARARTLLGHLVPAAAPAQASTVGTSASELRDDAVCIVAAVRTPLGSLAGGLASLSAPQLGSTAIKAALERAGVNGTEVDEVFMGNVLSAGLGQAPARQAALGAGIPPSVPCTTVNKVCSSGMKAIMFAAQAIRLGDADCVVAGGMESMSNVPHYLERFPSKMGDRSATDGMMYDGLRDAFHHYPMGNCAELCADENKITRQEQDDYAISSYKRAAASTAAGHFKGEIVPVEIRKRGKTVVVSEDEEYRKVNFDKLLKLRPVFKKGGSVTAGNASVISDGAAAVVLVSGRKAKRDGLKVIATVLAQADAAQAPEYFTTAPSLAIPKALAKARLAVADVDLFEINEAFAVVALVNNRLLKLDPSKVNVYGGAVSLGHPLGTSGARIVVTLLSALKQKQKQIGVAGICNGGGGASALVIKLA